MRRPVRRKVLLYSQRPQQRHITLVTPLNGRTKSVTKVNEFKGTGDNKITLNYDSVIFFKKKQ